MSFTGPEFPENFNDEEFKKAVLNLQDQKEGGIITGRDVKEMMKRDFDIECANSTFLNSYKIMHKVGLSWISGRTRHPKQDLEAQETFKKIQRHSAASGSGRCRIKGSRCLVSR